MKALTLTQPWATLAATGHKQVETRSTEYMRSRVSEAERGYGDYGPGRYAWILTNIEQLEPIPCKGALGLWEWKELDDVNAS